MFHWLRMWRARRAFRRFDANREEAERMRAEARGFDGARCAALVEDLVSRDRDRASVAYRALGEAGPPSVRPLIAALGDPRFHDASRRLAYEDQRRLGLFHRLGRRYWPLPQVLGLLERHQPLPPEAVEPLQRLCASPEDLVRERAGRLLAGMGRLADVDEYRRRVAGNDYKTVRQALSEMSTAVDRGHGHAVVLELFEDLVAVSDSHPSNPLYTNHRQAAELMLRVDRRRAVEVLMAPERLRPENPGLLGILEALVNAGEKVPPDRLLPLLEGLWRHEEAVWSFSKRCALRLAARVQDPACRAFIERALYSSDDKVSAAAVPAWAEVRGLPQTVVERWLYRFDDEALPTVVRRWAAAHYFSRFSLNDGFGQPVAREDLLPLALAGMRAAGADRCAAIVERAAALLNEQGAECGDPRVRELEEEFFKLTDALEVKLILYAADYRDEFDRAEARQAAQEAAEAQKRGAT